MTKLRCIRCRETFESPMSAASAAWLVPLQSLTNPVAVVKKPARLGRGMRASAGL